MASSNDPFESCRSKVRRAQEHCDTLKDEVGPWYKSDPYRIIKNYDSETRRHISTLELDSGKRPPLERWSLLSADCVHNLRTALDHLAYGVAIAESRKDPPPFEDMIPFPIADDSTKFGAAMKRYKLDFLRSILRKAIETMQPYNQPNPFDARIQPSLAILRDLENRDKHRLLRLVTGQMHRATIDELKHDIGTNITEISVHVGPLEDRTPFLSFATDKPTPDVKYTVMATLGVCVRYGSRPYEFIEVCTLNSWFLEEVSKVIEVVVGAI